MSISSPILVLGYGNELCGDDAVGPDAAAAVAGWKLEGVRVLVRHQLAPELAEEVARAREVIFVDAAASLRRRKTKMTLLPSPAEAGRAVPRASPLFTAGHALNPSDLLALALALYGRAPSAWLVTIPCRTFTPGAARSALARRGLREALALLRARLTTDLPPAA